MVITQLPPTAIVPPVNDTDPLPSVAVNVPPQVFEVAAGVVLTSPAGYVSVKATPVSAVPAFGFVMVNVSVELTPATVGFGEKDLDMEGGVNVIGVTVCVSSSSSSGVCCPLPGVESLSGWSWSVTSA